MGCKDSNAMRRDVYDQRSMTSPRNYQSSSYNQRQQSSTNKNAQNGSQGSNNFAPFYYELQQMYLRCNGDLKKFIRIIEERVSQIYMKISQLTLSDMNRQQIQSSQLKTIISEQVLSLNLNILKVIGRYNKFEYNKETFKELNRFQKSLVGYLKTKYPRGAQSFVPGELMNVFKEFDRTDDLVYDILKNSNTYFGQTSEAELTKNIKVFLNKIINQLDSKFPIFQKLMQERAFVVKNQKHQKVILNYKIGRKISENAPDYEKLDTGALQINSPEIFRVLIKWMEDLQETILNPNEKINKKQNFKCFVSQKHDGNIQFDYINQYEYSDLINVDMISKIQGVKTQYDKKNQQLLGELDDFNTCLLKILNQKNTNQKYVPMKDMEIIKYSNLNAKFVEYMLAQKLVFAIKKLIQVGKSFKGQIMMNLDLIKFRITDIMRCMISGNKKQILQVYNNFKQLQAEGIIQIVKIKNRLSTPLNDAMILFVIKNSFLICQAQLILSQAGEKIDKKSKNIELINHFFYQLQRSPYGILAQIAVLLAYKDSKISYEQKITFQESSVNFENCKKNHKFNFYQFYEQSKPFICSKCSCFYNKFKNLFVYYECKACKILLCSKCIIKNNPQLQTQFIIKDIEKQVQQRLQAMEAIQKSKYSSSKKSSNYSNSKKGGMGAKEILNVFEQDRVQLKQIFGDKNRIHASKLMQQLNINRYNTKAIYYFAIANFVKGEADLKYYRYDPSFRQIENTFDPKQRYDEKSYFYYTDYDILFRFKNLQHNTVKNKQITPKHLFMFIQKKQLQYKINEVRKAKKQGKIKNQQNYQIVSYKLQNLFLLVIDYEVVKKQGQEGAFQYSDNSRKVFKYKDLHVFTQKLPDLRSAKTIVEFDDLGIQSAHLLFFEEINWQRDIKQIKLTKNNITNISPVLSRCQNLQRLYINENQIAQLIFTRSLPFLQILNGSTNIIKKIQGLKFINNIRKIVLSNNQLIVFPKCSQLKLLNILNLSTNYLENIDNILASQLPQLQQLIVIQQYKYYNDSGQEQKEKKGFFDFFHTQSNIIPIKFPQLKSIELSQNQNLFAQKQINFYSHTLQKISLSGCSIKKLIFTQSNCLQNLQFLVLSNNQIQNFSFFQSFSAQTKHKSLRDSQVSQTSNSSNNYNEKIYNSQSLISLDLSYNLIEYLPILNFFSIKKLNLSYNKLKDIRPLAKSKMLQLQQLQLQGNQIQQIYLLCFPKLKALNISENQQISNLSGLFKNSPQLGNLQTVFAGNCGKVKFNFDINLSNNNLEKLKNLYLQGNQFVQQQKTKQHINGYFQIESLEFLDLSNCIFQTFPLMKLNKLKTLNFSYVTAQTFKDLQKCKFNSLQRFELLTCNEIPISQINEVPLKNNQNLQQKANNLEFSKYISCHFDLLSLKQLSMTYQTCLASIKGLQQSNLPKLQKLNLKGLQTKDNNKIPKLKLQNLIFLTINNFKINNLDHLFSPNLKKLQEVDLSDCQIQNISENTISFLPSVRTFNLTRNLLTKFVCTKHLDRLQKLDLSFNKITSYPRIKAKKLTDLKLEGNVITDLVQLQNCDTPLIETINLSNCDLSQKGFPVLNLPNLKKLELVGCKIKTLQNLSKCNLSQLTLLNLEQNQFQYFPAIYFNRLEDLRLSNNKIKNSDWIQKSKLPLLSVLVLNSNILQKCPSFNFFSLKKLWFNSLNIKYVPMMNLPNIELLQLESNELQDISDFCLGQYPQIEQFSVSKNSLTFIPKLLMPSLLSVFFSDNQISQIGQFCQSYLPYLQTIVGQNNKLNKINSLPFSELKQIFLSNNPLTQLKCFNLPEYLKLERIVASSNKISKIQLQSSMPSLINIQIHYSQIGDLEWLAKSYQCMPSLERISLYSNQIQEVPWNINEFKQLKYVQLGQNPIKSVQPLANSDQFSKISYFRISLDLQDKLFDLTLQRLQAKNQHASVQKYNQSFANLYKEQTIQN